jgi:hypothetical protein
MDKGKYVPQTLHAYPFLSQYFQYRPRRHTHMLRKAYLRSLLSPLNRQVTNTVAALRQESARRKKEIVDLKAEMARWQKVMNGRIVASRLQTAKRPRLDWDALLRELPARFTTKEVATKAGKPLPQVYAGVYRWVKDKKITKDKAGYRKLSSARA